MGGRKHSGGSLAALRRTARRFYLDHIDARLVASGAKPPEMDVTMVSSQEEYQRHVAQMQSEYKRRKEIDDSLVQDAPKFVTRGYCIVCNRWVRLRSGNSYAIEVEGRKQITGANTCAALYAT